MRPTAPGGVKGTQLRTGSLALAPSLTMSDHMIDLALWGAVVVLWLLLGVLWWLAG